MEPARIIRGIEAIAHAVRQSQVADPATVIRCTEALASVAWTTRHHGKLAVDAAVARIKERLLKPVDPSEIPWNVFRLFEIEDSETDWTLWLAGTLSAENGSQLSSLMWRSLCDSIVRSSLPPQPCEASHRLATLEDWRRASRTDLLPGCVSRERADPAFGRTDIVIDSSDLFVVIENKLDAGWHDGDGDPQAVRYRKFGLKHRDPDQLLGLVLLVKHDSFELDHRCRDYVRVLYRDLAKSLRREVRTALPAEAPATAILTLWPALLTIAAIERDLLKLDIRRWRRAESSWQSITFLNEICLHLCEED